MNASRAANRVEVTLGGKGVTSRAGLVVVSELADRLGLTRAMSAAMSPIVKRRRRRDPGVALAHVALLLADGGDCLSDLAVLRDEPDLFGVVASDSTALRALESGWAAEAIIDARRVARDAAWAAGAAPKTVSLELDATLLDAHSDKEDAAPTYKGGFGFHPLCCFLDDQRGPGGHAALGQRRCEQCRGPHRGPHSGDQPAPCCVACGPRAGRRQRRRRAPDPRAGGLGGCDP